MAMHFRVRAGRGALVCLFLLLGLRSEARAQEQIWSWQVEDVGDLGRFTSLAVDLAGDLHLAYSGDQGTIRYGFRPAGGSHWFLMTLDKMSTSYTGIALDGNGNPSVCYANGVVKYIHFDGKQWVGPQEIGPNSGVRSYTCSVAVSNDGTPQVTWYHEIGPDGHVFAHLKYAVLKESAWMVRTVDFDYQAGKWNSMVVDATGYPHLAYTSYSKGELKYAYWNGTNWKLEVVDSREQGGVGGYERGLGTSLILAPDGTARISYFIADNATQGDATLKYAQKKDGQWVRERVDGVRMLGSWQGFRSSLVLDGNGLPHTTYDDGGSLKHAYWDGKQWHTQVLVAGGSDPYRYASMAVGPDNTLYISYRDDDGSIKVAVGHLAKVKTQITAASTK
jgi:hypothetical protein